MKIKPKIKMIVTIALIALLALMVFSGCSAQKADSPNKEGVVAPESGSLIMPSGQGRKIVYTVSANIETKNIPASIESLMAEVEKLNEGSVLKSYVSKSEISQFNAYVIIKISTENLNKFLEKFSSFGDVVNRQVNSEDITDMYSDAAAELAAYKTELALLQDLLSQQSNPDTAFRYTTRITEINKKINYYQSMINSFDSAVDYSTVTLRLYSKGTVPIEVKYGTKIEQTFFGSLKFLVESLKFLLIVIVAVSPFAALGAVILVIVALVVRYLKKKYPHKFKQKSRQNIELKLNEGQDTNQKK